VSSTSSISAGLAALRLARQGAWTNDPSDPNYEHHWNTQQLCNGESVIRVVPGIAQREDGALHPRQPVNLRVTDQHTVYVDTPKITPVGPLAGAAQALRRQTGMLEPLALLNTNLAGELHASGNGAEWAIHPRPDSHVGQMSDMSPLGQALEAWKFARGR
jgi:hypothetical protein